MVRPTCRSCAAILSTCCSCCNVSWAVFGMLLRISFFRLLPLTSLHTRFQSISNWGLGRLQTRYAGSYRLTRVPKQRRDWANPVCPQALPPEESPSSLLAAKSLPVALGTHLQAGVLVRVEILHAADPSCRWFRKNNATLRQIPLHVHRGTSLTQETLFCVAQQGVFVVKR